MRRRFNTVVLPLPDSAEEEVEIVRLRLDALGGALELPPATSRARGDPPRRDDLPRAALRRHRGRAHEAQVAVRHAVHRRGDLGRHQRARARRPLRRRRAARRGPRGRAHRRGRPGPGAGHASSGRSTSRPSCASATAGARCTGPAASCDRTPSSGSATTDPARPAALRARARGARARHGPDRGPARGRRADPAGRARGHGPARRAAHLRRPTSPAAPPSTRSPASRPSGGRSGTRSRTTSRSASWTCRRRTSWPSRGEREPRTARPGRPARRAGRGRRPRRPRALVGGRRRVPARGRRVRGRDRGDGGAARGLPRATTRARSGARRYMRQSIRAADQAGARTIAVVCGAWHAPALDRARAPRRPTSERCKGLPKVKVAATWVPWTYGLLARASGYGAGVDSPAWYDQLFDEADDSGRPLAQPRRAAAARRGPRRLRRAGGRRRAARRARWRASATARSPGLDELLDATRAVLCHGTDVPLALVRAELVVGHRLGEVPERHADGPAPAGRLAPAAAAAPEARGAGQGAHARPATRRSTASAAGCCTA